MTAADAQLEEIQRQLDETERRARVLSETVDEATWQRRPEPTAWSPSDRSPADCLAVQCPGALHGVCRLCIIAAHERRHLWQAEQTAARC